MNKFDIVIMGHISRDILIYKEEVEKAIGGPVTYSSMAAQRAGAKVLILTKGNKNDRDGLDLQKQNGIEVIFQECPTSTSIENIYYTADRETRDARLISEADPFSLDDVPELKTEVIYMGGLFRGEIPEALIEPMSQRAKLGLDAQGLLRCSEEGKMVFRDWPNKKELLPYVTFFKTDAAEAKILTGLDDRYEAAKILNSWGAKEVMVTFNKEVIVCRDGECFAAPLTPENLSGRTGRGDTCFAAYIAWRLEHAVEESVRFSAALVSLKMETPGAFGKSVDDVMKKMEADAA
jgi:sugar/nucleoside kinase (ribokinase family)